MKLRPMNDRIMLRRIDSEEKSPGGIIIPDAAKEKPQRGVVLAVGPGRLLDDGTRSPVGCKKGDEVLFGKYSGSELTFEDKEVLICREDDILGVVES